MTYSQKIRRLYNLGEIEKFGFTENEIDVLEKRLNIKLPERLKNYYLILGKNENINYSHNRLLKPDKEIRLSNDGYLIFYEENQEVAHWGIKEVDLKLDNPPVWGNYGTGEQPDWHLEVKTTEDFFLLMTVYNGTLGGLKYNANSFKQIKTETLEYIKKNWIFIPEVSWERQQIYTDSFEEVISLSYDKDKNCVAIFIGTSYQERFNKLLDKLEIDWSYTSYDDEYEDGCED